MKKYKTINGWTKEAMIEQVKKYVPNTPGRPCKKNGICSYSDGRGHRCAVGAFIPNALRASFKVEGTVDELLDQTPEVVHFLPLEEPALQEMQREHDWCEVGYPYEEDSPQERVVNWIMKRVRNG